MMIIDVFVCKKKNPSPFRRESDTVGGGNVARQCNGGRTRRVNHRHIPFSCEQEQAVDQCSRVMAKPPSSLLPPSKGEFTS